MRAATEVRSRVPFELDEDALPAQLPLPLPGTAGAVLPVPQTRGRQELARELRAPVTRFMQGLAEVLCGGRPARQLTAWMTPEVHAALVQRLLADGVSRVGARGRLASVHLSVVDDHAAEVAGRLVQDGRSRAVAVRFERVATPRGGQVWTCTALVWA